LGFSEKEELVLQISKLVGSLSAEEKKAIFDTILINEKKGMPISIFKANISALAIIIKYFREIQKKAFKEISQILNRKQSTLYNTYYKSRSKCKEKLDDSDYSITIPPNIFKNRKYSILESLVEYLKDKQNLSLTQISKLLGKKYSTIKTVYWRYNKKREKYE
jgi:hypothetical protein